VDEDFAKDKNSVYHRGKKIDKIDVTNFQIISNRYYLSRDKNYVYFETGQLKNSDAETFEILNDWFWKDKNNVYYFSLDFYPYIIENTDPETFEIILNSEEPKAKDKYKEYKVSDLMKIYEGEHH